MRKKTIRIGISYSLMIGLWASAFRNSRGFGELYAGTPRFVSLVDWVNGIVGFAVLTHMHLPDMKDIPAILSLGFLGFTLYHILLNIGEKQSAQG